MASAESHSRPRLVLLKTATPTMTDPTTGNGLARSRMALIFATGFMVTTQWSGVVVGSVQASDFLLLLCLAAAAGQVVASTSPSIRPTGPYVLLATVCASSVLAQVHPPSESYLLSRQVFVALGDATLGPSAGVNSPELGPLLIIVKLFASTVGAWILVRVILGRRPRAGAHFIAGCWLAGSTISAMIATIQARGIPLFSSLISHTAGSRPSGLAFHPDSLGLYLAATIPLLAFLFQRRALVPVGLFVGVALWSGILSADSRSALVCAVAATIALPLCAVRPGQAAASSLTIGLLLSPLVAAGVIYLKTQTRLASGAGSASDVGHAAFAHQALADFRHSPAFGIGFQNGLGAPFVALAILGAGGLISFSGYLFFWSWIYARAIPHLSNRSVRIFAMSSGVVLVCNFASNNFTDRGEYVFGFVAVLLANGTKSSIDRTGPIVITRTKARKVVAPIQS